MRFGAGVVACLLPAVVAADSGTGSSNAEPPDHKTHFQMPHYASRRQWEPRKRHLRSQILSAAGLLPMPVKSPLHPKIVRRLDYSDYSIEVLLLETLPGYYLAGNLYWPTRSKLPAPGVLVPHGHWKRGRLEDQASYSVPALGINLARQGYVAFAYDMAGYNDTRQTPHSFGGPAESLWSFHPMGLQLWNSICAVDFLQALPDVDAQRIAATGASGGATQTFLLAAVDERVRYAAPVNMVSAYMQGGDPCEDAPNLRLNTFNVEIAATIAPRPMLLVSSTRDWTRHTPAEEFPAIRRIYELYGASQSVENAHMDAEHNYNRQSREAVYRFFARHMMPHLNAAELADREFQLPPEEQLLAFKEADRPRDLAGLEQLFLAWKVAAIMQTQGPIDPMALRAALGYALGAAWPQQVEAAIEGNRVTVSLPGKRDPVSGYWRPGKGNPVLVVHPAGTAAALQTGLGEKMLLSDRPLLVIEPFRSDPVRSRKRQAYDYFLSYNRTDEAQRVQDILTALSFLRARSRGRLELIGVGDAGIACLFAAAIAPVRVNLLADLNGFGGSDEDFRDRFFVPGIQRAGGLSAALRLVSSFRAAIPAWPVRPRPATE